MKKISYLAMVRELLSEEEFLQFAQWYTQPVHKSIKILTSRIDRATFQAEVAKDGWALQEPAFSFNGKVYDDVLFVDKQDKQSLGSHPWHQEGYFYVQEMAAGLAAQVLDVQAGDVVLDMCAAPGGKSVQLGDRLLQTFGTAGVGGLLISNEVHPARRKALQANMERCRIWNLLITGYDGRQLGDLLAGQCDKVLLDAPCSGEGMQYKSDFKVYHWNEKASRKLAHLQRELLFSGLRALKEGGELVYATCTTNVIENEMVVASALEFFGDAVELVSVDIAEKAV
jgi:16S rRNA C967 or C1407 C5-methylase (RsmB/RsmF family)